MTEANKNHATEDVAGNRTPVLEDDDDKILGLPDENDIQAVTNADEPDLNLVGTNTDKLSDHTGEEDDERTFSKTKHSSFSVWYKQIQPLVKNRRVRCFSLMNLMLFLINMCLVIALFVMIIFMIVLLTSITGYKNSSKPCLIEWNQWSNCSHNCTDLDSGIVPLRYRKIKKDRLIEARGSYLETAPCPKNVHDLIDVAPCNTHLCPKNLGSYSFVGPFQKNAADKQAGCYKIRNIPREDRLIYIDTTELIQEDANCL